MLPIQLPIQVDVKSSESRRTDRESRARRRTVRPVADRSAELREHWAERSDAECRTQPAEDRDAADLREIDR